MMRTARCLGAGVVAALALTLAACIPPETAKDEAGEAPARTRAPDLSTEPPVTLDGTPSAAVQTVTRPSLTVRPAARFDADAAMRTVRHLAGEIGPRLATGPAFERAADWVQAHFVRLGYDVRRQSFPVPAGDSWGVPVAAGRSVNVIAAPPGFDPGEPHLLIGAHLDTIAVAPGAEDNASGVAVLLEVARLAMLEQPRLPTVFVAFGAEEPRGPRDDQHHFGSLHYVDRMASSQRDALRAMVALDRVGHGTWVPVCTGPLSPGRVQQQLLAVADRLRVPARPCELTTSDHWSFEKAGFTVARLGGAIEYSAYHSARDVPQVVSGGQLARTGRVAWGWLAR